MGIRKATFITGLEKGVFGLIKSFRTMYAQVNLKKNVNKKIVADLSPDKQMLQDVLEKSCKRLEQMAGPLVNNLYSGEALSVGVVLLVKMLQ